MKFTYSFIGPCNAQIFSLNNAENSISGLPTKPNTSVPMFSPVIYINPGLASALENFILRKKEPKNRIKHKSFPNSTIDVSGIIEKFNVYATLAIMPRTKEINKAS